MQNRSTPFFFDRTGSIWFGMVPCGITRKIWCVLLTINHVCMRSFSPECAQQLGGMIVNRIFRLGLNLEWFL